MIIKHIEHDILVLNSLASNKGISKVSPESLLLAYTSIDLKNGTYRKKGTYRPQCEKTCLQGFENNKGTDQPAHLGSLISTFVVRLL